MTSEKLVIASRFCGPPGSANGGYVCGRLGLHLEGTVAVRLKAPPRLETELHIERSDSGVELREGSTVIAEARPADLDLVPPAAPSFAEAQEAAKSCAGFASHPFPRCFVCGPQRAAGDGMRIFPGPVASRPMVAAPWVPHPSLTTGAGDVAPEFLWAALDCTSAFAVLPIPEETAIVLGELRVRVDGRVTPGEACTVIGWPLHTERRKRLGASAILSESHGLVAVGRATWIEVPWNAFATP